jgi:hypothetical protein
MLFTALFAVFYRSEMMSTTIKWLLWSVNGNGTAAARAYTDHGRAAPGRLPGPRAAHCVQDCLAARMCGVRPAALLLC